MTEDAIKERLIAIIKDNFGDHGVKEDVAGLENFGLYLSQNMVYNRCIILLQRIIMTLESSFCVKNAAIRRLV